MKKGLLSLVFVVLATLIFAQCNELFISEYVEGSNNNKALELYNPTNGSIDLSGYRLIRFSNGSVTSDQSTPYVLALTGTIPADGAFVICLDKRNPQGTGQDTAVFPELQQYVDFWAPGDYDDNIPGSKVVFWNGDDAIALQKNIAGVWQDIDIFGKIGERPVNWQGGTSPTGGWDDTAPYADGQGTYLSKDHTLVRKSSVQQGVSTNPTEFNALAEWDSLPENTFDQLGDHNCSCHPDAIDETNANTIINIYPNPITENTLFIDASNSISNIIIVNVIGQTIFNNTLENKEKQVKINTEKYTSGMYVIKIKTTDNHTITKKIIIN